MSKRLNLEVWTPLGVAALMLLMLLAIGQEFLQGFVLDLGRSLNAPTPNFGLFLVLWMFFGGLASGALALALMRWARKRNSEASWVSALLASSERKWLVYVTAFAFLIPAALRSWVLGGAVLTDDESAYRLMAELIASGRVYGDSHPLKLFFDNRFIINDGKVYSHYFLGWPALLAPGVWLGITGWMNALYSALTIPALWAVVKRLFGAPWARVATLLYLASPMMMLAAATETAHTSCVLALAWMTLFWLRTGEEDASWWNHAGLAFCFSVAFFNRPTSALGIGLPFLMIWLWARLRQPEGRWLSLAAFTLPATLLAGLFLMVNLWQTGSFFEVAYQRAFTYAAENDFRFSLWSGQDVESFTELNFSGPMRSLAVAGAALFRFSITFMGWPCSILFAIFAGRRRIGVFWGTVLSYFVIHLVTDNVGIDTFAPMHYFELAWPFLILNVAGLVSLTKLGKRFDDLEQKAGLKGTWQRSAVPVALALSLVLVGLVTYVPVRFNAIQRIANNVSMPWKTLEDAGIERAVIFAPEPFIFYCLSAPTSGWVFVRPNNDPQLENDILWANHLTLERNRELMQHFPDRPGYVMGWDRTCKVQFLPLDRLPPGSVPDAKLPHFRDLDAPDREI